MHKYRQNKTNKSKTPLGSIRIISGLWRGRKLPVRDAQGLRPTTDRIKETLFNWLAPDIASSDCLDLFAGSGGLGFEAASRQAKFVTMIELDLENFKLLEQNINTLQTNAIDVLNQNALDYLQTCQKKYDIIFLDPPFRADLIDKAIELIEKNQLLKEGAYVYIEVEKELTNINIPTSWQLHREKTTGQVTFCLYVKKS